MLSFLKKQGSHSHNTAVAIDKQGASLTAIDIDANPPRLIDCFYQPAEPDMATALKQLLPHAGKNPVTTITGVGSYSLLLVDMPNVPATEMKSAVRWQIKDLIDFHIDDAIIDVFDAPESPSRAQPQLYVVVARQDAVQSASTDLVDAGFCLDTIDIPELVLRNLSLLTPEPQQGCALLLLEATQGLIALCKDGVLYLARTIELGYETLVEAQANGQDYQLDNLALEVQRSLDYYDRYFQQAPITRLYSIPLPVQIDGLHKSLQANLGLESRDLPLREALSISADIDDTTLGHCALAIGAALRRESKTL